MSIWKGESVLKNRTYTEEIKILSLLKNLNPYTDKIPNITGVYIITFESEYYHPLIYIGYSRDVSQRIKNHRNYKRTIKKVDILQTDDIKCANILELVLISRIKPILNKYYLKKDVKSYSFNNPLIKDILIDYPETKVDDDKFRKFERYNLI